jgi:enolase-phosphatase E1
MSNAVRHVLLDIEGTTCPLSFVAEVLFPYAQSQLPLYLAQHRTDPALISLAADLLRSWREETDPEASQLLKEAVETSTWTGDESGLDPETTLPYLQWLNRQDRKLTAWKDLQGQIWEEGYRSGDLKACLFPDVGPTLKQWHSQGMVLSVYSSGSVAAQKLLYGHTQDGDLRPLFSHWYDTRIGAKQESESYRKILKALQSDGEDVLFLSDTVAELEAASFAGIRCLYSDRPGNLPQDPGRFRCVRNFSDIECTF